MLRSLLHADNFVFSLLQWFLYSVGGSFFAFLAAYYHYVGFSDIQVGFSMSVVALVSIVGMPLLGFLADKMGSVAAVLMAALMLGASFLLLIFFAETQYFTLTAFSALATMCIQPLASVIDGWTMTIKKVLKNLDYGFCRSVGSIGFALTTALAGMAYDRWGMHLMFLAATIFALVTAFFVFHIHRKTGKIVAVAPQQAVKQRKFFSAPVLSILLIFTLSFIPFRSAQIFLPILLDQLGGRASDVGYAFGMAAISEVPFMIASSWLIMRYSDTKVLLVALVFFCLRVFVPLIAPTPTWLILAQTLQGPSFGLFLPASVHLLYRLAPEGSKSLAQTMRNLATYGLGSIFAGVFGGILTDALGLRAMYGIMSVIMPVIVVGYFIAQKRLQHSFPLTGTVALPPVAPPIAPSGTPEEGR